MSTVALIAVWYLVGFGAAAVMIDRGSSPTPWWVAAALLGGVTALLAAGVSILRRRAVTPTVDAAPGTGTHALAIVGTSDSASEVVRVTRGLPAVDRSTVLCAVGAEAWQQWIDTGEQAAGHRTLERAARRLGPSISTAVVPARGEEVASQIARQDPVDIVVTSVAQLAPVTRGWSGHLLSDRAGALSGALSAPVLIAPDRADVPATSRATTKSGVA